MLDAPSTAAGVIAAFAPGASSSTLGLDGGELAFCVAAVFLAGIVRGFAGFALSALIMASVAVIVPPVSLIPVCFVLEGVASLLMFRGGLREADWRIVRGLSIGSAVGVPLGLQATLHLAPDTSRLVALVLIATLAALQLVGIRGGGGRPAPDRATTGRPDGGSSHPTRPPSTESPADAPPLGERSTFTDTSAVRYAAGVLAGIATGLASVGGMIVALYVLASAAAPARMRASLVMFLFVGMFTSGGWLLASGVLDRLALLRGLVLAPPVVVGVLLGAWLFRPSLQGFYRRFCLTLLIGLALVGLVRLAVANGSNATVGAFEPNSSGSNDASVPTDWMTRRGVAMVLADPSSHARGESRHRRRQHVARFVPHHTENPSMSYRETAP